MTGKPISHSPTIVWFRDDLRIMDNPALFHAAKLGGPIVCVYIRETTDGLRSLGGAVNWWLHHSLTALGDDLSEKGMSLSLRSGDPQEILLSIVEETGATHVVWNRRYAPAEINVDTQIKTRLKEQGLPTF